MCLVVVLCNVSEVIEYLSVIFSLSDGNVKCGGMDHKHFCVSSRIVDTQVQPR